MQPEFLAETLRLCRKAGIHTCIDTAGVGMGGALVALTFRLNRKYGAYGLMKLLAARRHPRRIVSRKSVARILNRH